jgi:hypothetical protein
MTSVSLKPFKNRRCLRSALHLFLPVMLVTAAHTPAHALATIWFGGVSALSLGVATGIVAGAAGGAVATGVVVGTVGGSPKVGTALAVGGTALALADPPDGAFYNGSWTIVYPSNLLAVNTYGWLGDWGAQGAVAPPVAIQPGDTFVIQSPNAGMSTSTTDDAVNGLLTTSFDWGPGGHVEGGLGSFNFFAAAFTAKQDLNIVLLGTAPAGDASGTAGGNPNATDPGPLGSNFYITTPGVYCIPNNDLIMRTCGEQVTEYYLVSAPEPAAWADMLLGLCALCAVTRVARARRRVVLVTGRNT